MAKQATKVVTLTMRVTVTGEDRFIRQITINGKRVPEKAILALAATLHRNHIR